MRASFALLPVLLSAVGCSSSSSPAAPADTGGVTLLDGASDTGVDAPADVPSCTSLRETTLGPIARVSTGEVKILDDTGGTKTLYVDATAGGFGKEGSNPWTFVDLATGKKVDIDDKAAMTAKTWDLAFKRAMVRTNSNDSGPGSGGAALLDGKAFGTITADECKAAKLQVEIWFDADCNALRDATGALATTLHDWYVYDSATSKLAVAPGVWIVRGADGTRLYKLEFVDYYKKPDGTSASGSYTFRYAEVK